MTFGMGYILRHCQIAADQGAMAHVVTAPKPKARTGIRAPSAQVVKELKAIMDFVEESGGYALSRKIKEHTKLEGPTLHNRLSSLRTSGKLTVMPTTNSRTKLFVTPAYKAAHEKK